MGYERRETTCLTLCSNLQKKNLNIKIGLHGDGFLKQSCNHQIIVVNFRKRKEQLSPNKLNIIQPVKKNLTSTTIKTVYIALLGLSLY